MPQLLFRIGDGAGVVTDKPVVRGTLLLEIDIYTIYVIGFVV
jgi:hypothetical protein